MAIKVFCDICTKELDDPKFYCELNFNRVREISIPVREKELQIRPQMEKRNLHLCSACFTSKFPDLPS